MLTHRGLTSHPLENVEPADPGFEQRALLCVPLYHVAGVQVMLSSVYGGRVLVVQGQFEAGEWLRLVEEERVGRSTVVPTMLKMILEHPDLSARDLSSLRLLTYGAAPMPAEVILSAIRALPGVRFINAFGQTETGATITALAPEDHVLAGDPDLVARRRRRLRSIGRPLQDVELRVVDEDGAEVEAGRVGEIVARGPGLMKGYWRRDEATAEATRGGWLHTGDLGRVDGDGYVYLEGRARDFIKRGGEMISPEEVEDVLRGPPVGRRRGGDRGVRPALGRVGAGGRRPGPGGGRRRDRADRALQGGPGQLQAPRVRGHRRGAAQERDGQGPKARAAPTLRRALSAPAAACATRAG